jgi:hypothetical protein
MEISTGSGLMLGLFFIGIAILVVGTKDRFGWIKFLKRILNYSLFVLFIVFFVYLLFAVGSKIENQYKKWARSNGLNRLSGLSFDNTLEDVVFIKGQPDYIGSNSFGGIVYVYKSKDEVTWDNLLISFSERRTGMPPSITNKIVRIKSKDASDLVRADFGEIKFGDDINTIKTQYIGEFEWEIHKSLLERKYQIGNIVFFLINNRLDSVSISNPDTSVEFGDSEIKKVK